MLGTRRWLRHIGLALVLVVIASGCRSTVEITMVDDHNVGSNTGARNIKVSPEQPDDNNPFADRVTGGGIDFRLSRNDVECTERRVNRYPDLPVIIAHVVVDGNLGEPCFGEPDDRLIAAWKVLAAITPPGELNDLGVFVGFVSNERSHTTLAFVNEIAADDTQYQMSINIDEAERDPDELMLTMAHEFAHVMTTNPAQLDESLYPNQCETWHNLRGCFRDDSLMWQWIQTFWADGLIGEVRQKVEPSPEVGGERCALNPGFFGPYAASHPEEDFAEAFSAFVFRIEVESDEQQAKMRWFAEQPALLQFRNHAIESGLGPLSYDFAPCG